MKKHFKFSFLILATLLLSAIHSLAQQSKPSKAGYAPVNGSRIYYEVYGEGKPIVLLHGAYMTIGTNWGEIIPELSKNRKVIAMEMEGHGHTPLSSRALSWDALAADVVNVLKDLKIDSADVIGYSFGGTIAYNLAINYPKMVNRVVIISSTYKYEGWQKEVRDVLQTLKPELFDNTPMKTEYDKVAPEPAKWNAFLTKMMAFGNQNYNLGDEKIRKIQSPVLIISGDNDGVDKPILIDTYRKLGGGIFADMVPMPKSQLAIVPGQGHVSVMMQSSTILQHLSAFLK